MVVIFAEGGLMWSVAFTTGFSETELLKICKLSRMILSAHAKIQIWSTLDFYDNDCGRCFRLGFIPGVIPRPSLWFSIPTKYLFKAMNRHTDIMIYIQMFFWALLSFASERPSSALLIARIIPFLNWFILVIQYYQICGGLDGLMQI